MMLRFPAKAYLRFLSSLYLPLHSILGLNKLQRQRCGYITAMTLSGDQINSNNAV